MSLLARVCRPLVLAVTSLAATSCIAWTGELSELEPEDFRAPQHPRALTFESVYRVNGEDDEKRSTKSADLVAEALRDTGVFASAEATTTRGELHVAFTFEETYNEGAVFASSFLSGFTFFLLPAYAKGRSSVEAMVYEGGVERGPVRLHDDYHFVMQIFLLPVTPFFWPPKVSDDLLRNLVFHVVQEAGLVEEAGAQASF